MVTTFVDLAVEFKLPRWTGFWGSRFLGVTGGILFDMIQEGSSTALTAQYLYDFGTREPDAAFDQPLDALAQLGKDALRPLYAGEAHYASLRVRLRNKWTFWQAGRKPGMLEEFEAAFGAKPSILVPKDSQGRSTPIGASELGSATCRGMIFPRWTIPEAHTVLKSVSIYVGATHTTQARLSLYEGGTPGDASTATLIRDLGQTTGAVTEGWLKLPASDEPIDTAEHLWILFKIDGSFSVRYDATDPDDFIDFARVFTVSQGTDPTVPFNPILAAHDSVTGHFYNVRIETGPAAGSEYWSRFWIRFADGDHPITGPGVTIGSFVVGTDTLGPAGATTEYLNTLREITHRMKPVRYVPWDYRFVLSNGDIVNLQGYPRTVDPTYTYLQIA